ncbi:MAG: hypothetical protein A3G76_07845 [Acidobacteria bacterium RIFCSPLOWO2_12_FULL_65_11]|nr:MAG: hypothetical protein A3H95_01150 [Acidobacteria bacterium RIFCSPLOWO2_02_FULL_64_15]OFW31837.1 MAG: hypothetical protein A3G76_07845 [Acidobacteria bacterium RIFCSPLOWO2_12_FULL_65_11]
MNTTDDRDRSIDNLLRQSFQASGGAVAPSSSCLNAETLAAWAEGRLSKNGLAMAEVHLADCARCQGIAAVLAKMPASDSASERRWQWGLALRWLVPLAAGATAVALWVAVPDRSRQSAVGSPQSAADGQQSAAETKAAAPQASPEVGAASARADAAPPEQRDARKENDGPRAAADALGRVAERANVAPPAAAPTVAVPASEPVAGARVEAFALARQDGARVQEIASPTPSIRWRVGPRGLVEYSADSGNSWEPLSTGVVTDLVAGASPSPSVCWVIGRAGTVLLAVDGRRFNRVPFPVNADLTAIRATDARTATITTADGRTFSTSDGGSTWTQ